MKHYKDIKVFVDKFAEFFNVGDEISVTEKIDGANASICLSDDGTKLLAMSRRQELDETNTLRGFWNYVQTLDVSLLKDHPSWVLFGEMLVTHKIKYPEDKLNKFYLFDIFDKESGHYLRQEIVQKFAKENNLNTVPVFYEGPFTSMEDLMKYVGTTKMGGEKGEGIVIKNQSRLLDDDDKRPAYVKIVDESFKEANRVKIVDPEKMAAKELSMKLTERVVTKARVEKNLLKLVDEGIIPEDFDLENMGTIMKVLPKKVFDDCLKEEKDMVLEVGEFFGKNCSTLTAKYVKNFIMNR